MRAFRRNSFGGYGNDTPAQRTTDHESMYSPLEQAHNGIDRLFNGIFRGFMSPWDALPTMAGRSSGESGGFIPRMDLSATEKAYTVTLEVPGVNDEDVNLEVRDNTLIISGEKKMEKKEEEEAGFYRMERSYGSFQRSLALPEDAQIEGISATRKDGVLCVTVPRKEPESPTSRKIEISKE